MRGAVRRLFPATPRSAAVAALPVLALALVGLLAYEGWAAERARRAAEEAALRDHARFAAAQAARSLRNGVMNTTLPTVESVERGGAPTGPGAWDDERMYCPLCPAEDTATRRFRADLARGTVESDRPLPAAEREWVLRTLRGATETSAHARTVFARVGGRAWGMGFAVARDTAGRPVSGFGFLASPRAFEGSVRETEARYPLLPGGAARDTLVSYTARDSGGGVVFRSARAHRSPYISSDTTGRLSGGLRVDVVLHPRAGEVLLPGGRAPSRTPHIAVLLVLASALVAGALLQLRGERRLARMRTDFIANLSHELNTPVAQISLFAETLLLGLARGEEERRRSLEIIFRESVRLSLSVRNVSLFTQGARGGAAPGMRPARLDDEARAAVAAFAPVARAHGVEVAPLLEPLQARAGHEAVRLVLLNLLDNAVKYGPRGQRVTVELGLVDGGARLSVEDRGPGVPPAERRRIWEPFERLDREPERVKGGSGIGLAVVRMVAEQHGGRAWVEDGREGGARFVVEIPGASRVEVAAGG